MAESRREPKLGRVPDGTVPVDLQRFLSDLKVIVETITGDRGLNDSRPTVQQLIDAGITNADKIE